MLGWWLGLVISEVFSNLKDSMIYVCASVNMGRGAPTCARAYVCACARVAWVCVCVPEHEHV